MMPRGFPWFRASLVGIGIASIALPLFAAQIAGGGWSKPALAAVSTDRILFSGRDVPLQEAIERLVPDSERSRIVLEGDVGQRPVSWSSGRDWFETLRDAVRRSGMTMRRRNDGTWVIAAERRSDRPRELVIDAASPQSSRLERSEQSVSMMANAKWSARPGQSLEEVLRQWAGRAGWSVVYSTRISFIIESEISLDGSFEDAVRTLIDGIEARPAPRAVLYRGNRTLVVATGFEDLRP